MTVATDMDTADNLSVLRERVTRVLACAYHGIHHVPYWNRRKESAGTWPYIQISVLDGLSTYDFDTLTRLVVASHDECIRLEICGSAPNLLKLMFHLRARESEHMSGRHPTIEASIERIRA